MHIIYNVNDNIKDCFLHLCIALIIKYEIRNILFVTSKTKTNK